jgi:hypothetical protein
MLSDGYKIERSQRYVSASSKLLSSLRLFLQTMGYRVGKIHWQKKKRGTICVYRKLLKDAEYGYICFSKRKDWNIKKYPTQYRYQNFLIGNDHFEIETVKSIKSTRIIQPTLDLRVEKEHNFLADGIVVHNTGIQRSGLTPFGGSTTTSPAGKFSFGNPRPKKNLVEIALAHHIPYVASSTVGFPRDIQKKVKKALSFKGPKFIHLVVPCPLGWRFPSNLTYNIGRLLVETGLFPILEYENGKLTAVRKIGEPKPVTEYLKLQGRFKHLFGPEGKEELSRIQEFANKNISAYHLR